MECKLTVKFVNFWADIVVNAHGSGRMFTVTKVEVLNPETAPNILIN